MGERRPQRKQDLIKDRLRFVKHLVVPESQHTKSLRCDSTVSMLIMVTAVLMLSAIKLDYELCVETCEVGDIATDWHLAAETKATKLAAP